MPHLDKLAGLRSRLFSRNPQKMSLKDIINKLVFAFDKAENHRLTSIFYDGTRLEFRTNAATDVEEPPKAKASRRVEEWLSDHTKGHSPCQKAPCE